VSCRTKTQPAHKKQSRISIGRLLNLEMEAGLWQLAALAMPEFLIH